MTTTTQGGNSRQRGTIARLRRRAAAFAAKGMVFSAAACDDARIVLEKQIHAGHRGENAFVTDRYRVYPHTGRGRVFKHLANAQAFAEAAFSRQSIHNPQPIEIVRGTSSTFHIVGRYGFQGGIIVWTWDEHYTPTPTAQERPDTHE